MRRCSFGRAARQSCEASDRGRASCGPRHLRSLESRFAQQRICQGSTNMFDQEDEGTRIGVWTALAVVFLVVAGLIGGLAIRAMNAAAGGDGAQAVAGTETLAFVDGPLEGEVVGTVYFAVGQAVLPDGALVALDKAIQAVKDAPQQRVVLSGFHDASGAAALNAELAKARAKAVRAALVAEGVDAARIALRKPDVTLGDGAAPEARRVEIRLVE
ncbi:outer membrane related peptidoglycan-associated lipoprotein [Methylibium petroleiphilum PM1]|uniref:Outer membrane related peptidoglycan-associated lipoprotein n=2 Tax=Sphaerotilaceae TaxID=2975441 RepID=A2SBX5_METPP|nr:outer membrane related peptidoglycan-associated lipoprotein [Methylibium petroleiphilum PM1]